MWFNPKKIIALNRKNHVFRHYKDIDEICKGSYFRKNLKTIHIITASSSEYQMKGLWLS